MRRVPAQKTVRKARGFLRAPLFPALLLLGVCLPLAAWAADGQETPPAKAVPQDEESPAPLTFEELQAFAPSFVLVKFYFKRNEEMAQGADFDWREDEYEPESRYRGFIDLKSPMKFGGIAFAPGVVLTVDPCLDEQYLDYIEIDNLRGGVSRAERQALLQDAPGLLLKAADPEKLALKAVAFADAPKEFPPRETLFAIRLAPSQGKFFLTAGKTGAAPSVSAEGEKRRTLAVKLSPPSAQSLPPGYPAMPTELEQSPSLILNADKAPLGVALVEELQLAAGEPHALWAGKDLLADKTLPFEEFGRIKKNLEKTYADRLPEIKISFRQKAKGRRSSFDYSFSEDQEPPPDRYCYGLPISKRRLFVPSRMPREHAKVIDSILVKIGDRELRGRFAGAFQDVGAFLVELDEDALSPDAKDLLPGAFPQVTPVITVQARRKFGRKYIRVHYDRCLELEHGYKDVLEPIPLEEKGAGTFFVDATGRIHALLLDQRREDEDKEMFREGRSRGYFAGGGELRRVYIMDELLPYFKTPEPLLDKTIVWLPEEEEKRKMWLGVEFSPMTKDLAKALKVEKPTKDGQIGLVLSSVYPASPAAKIGLEAGDVLLKIKGAEEKEPIELKAPPGFSFSFDFAEANVPREMENMMSRMPRGAPWPTRKHLITDLLEVIGEGKTVELTYLDKERAEKTATFRVEQAPPDFQSTPKFKDETLGLTVKDVTYEVRYILLLPDDFRGIVVDDVEEGSPAAVARIGRYEIVLRIDDADVPGIEEYKAIIENARRRMEKEGKVTLRFTLQQLDRTHFADVTLE